MTTDRAPRTLPELLDQQVRIRGEAPALRGRQAGEWRPTSFHAWQQASRLLAAGLVSRGVLPGDRVAILLPTRPEFVLLEMGVLMAGAVPVPIYATLTPEQIAFILRDSGATTLVLEDDATLDRCLREPEFAEADRGLRLRVVLKGDRGERRVDLAGLAADGSALLEKDGAAVRAREEAVRETDIAAIFYTSGTSGEPKGVVLTHAHFLFEVATVGELLGVSSSDEQLLFLPLAHIFGKLLVVAALRVGATTAFARNMMTVLDDAEEVQPTFIGSVPRLFEKVHEVAIAKVKEAGHFQERIYEWALDTGRAVSVLKLAGAHVPLTLELQHRYADKLVFTKLRKRFGGRLRFAISGAAPLDESLAAWFHAVGITIYEGYGLTETTGATNINRPQALRFGSVGRPLPGVEVRIGKDGEVLVRGPNVLREYWGRAAETREAKDADGWFATGDVGVIDADGYLRITDRKKDLLVTAGGKNVAPQRIETLLSRSPYVRRAVVVGDSRPYLVALIVPAASADRAVLQRVVDEANAELASFETVKRFAILPDDLSVDRGEITPTLKVRRRVVEERYAELIDALY